MTQDPTPTPSQEEPGATGGDPAPPDGPWGEIVSPKAAAEVLAAARQLSRRGKLPGFEVRTGTGELFSFTAFGAPLDYVVSAVAAGDGTGTRVAFHAGVKRKVPLIFAAVAAVSVWPGGPITDSLIRSYFPSYDYPQWVTWAWYLPITVVPLPFMAWRMWKHSRRAAYEHCVESIGVLRDVLGG